MKKLNLILLILLLGIISCKKETDLESDIQPKDIETESLLSEISGPSIEEINLREYSSSQAADFFSLDFISSSSASAQTRSKVNLFLLKANETLYKYTSGDQAKLLIESIGYPAWDIGRVLGLYKEYGREIVYVPTFESDRKTVKALIYFEFSKEETVVVRTYDAKLYTLIYKQYPDETKAEYINSFFDFFNNQQNLSANTRDCGDACSWQETSWGRQCLQTSSGSMTTSGTPCPNECCLTGGGLDQGNEDLALWFTFGTFINPHIEIGGNNNSGGNNNTDPIHELINSSDEQAMIAFLMERFGWDATHPNVLSIVTYPNYMVAIIQHVAINGSSVESVQRFIDFMNNHGNLAGLSTEELITLINMLPQVRGKINLGILDNYLNSHDTDAVSVFVLHDIIRLVDGNPELTSAAPSILDDFYRALSPAVSDWIQNPLKVTFRRTVVNSYLINGGPFAEVEARRNKLLTNANNINSLLEQFDIIEQEINLGFLLQAEVEFTDEITRLMLDNSDNEFLMDAAGTAINLQASGIQNQDQVYLNILTENSPINPVLLQFLISKEIATLKQENPDWQDEGGTLFTAEEKIHLKAVMNVFLDGLHIAFDVAGLVPGAGILFDVVNGGIYTLQGEGVNATLSFAAAIPFAGWTATGAKYARKVVQHTATGTVARLRWAVDAAGVAHFGYRGQLKTILKPAANHQAHHILPWQFNSHPLIQKAAKANRNGSAYHPSDPFNGISVSNTRHTGVNGNHDDYSNRVRQFLDQQLLQNPNMSNNDAFYQVETFIQNLRNVIINNPNTPINNLIF